MLVFSVEAGQVVHRPTPPALALVLHVCIGLVLLAALASRFLSTNTRRAVLKHLMDDESDAHDEAEAEALMSREAAPNMDDGAAVDNDDTLSSNDSTAAAVQRVVLELVKLIGAAALIGVTIVKLMDEAVVAKHAWTDVLDAGVLLVAVSGRRVILSYIRQATYMGHHPRPVLSSPVSSPSRSLMLALWCGDCRTLCSPHSSSY